jgi:hypothetical protein
MKTVRNFLNFILTKWKKNSKFVYCLT